jgi:hypothetical protein
MTEINLPSTRISAPASQGTQIEQSRAIAEVQAMVVIAQNTPRDVDRATRAMRDACGRKALAERAFFAFPRAGGQVTGPSIHLARELARVWGNITYGVTELSRDDVKGESEMLAYAWDVETNTRSAHIFINPHARDTKRGRQRLNDLRDIYESNANTGARRVREAIFAVLPAWFAEEAQAVAHDALKAGDGKPLTDRIADAIERFSALGIGGALMVEKVGRSIPDWTPDDVARLGVLYQSLQRGEITTAEAFPDSVHAQRVTADEITGGDK